MMMRTRLAAQRCLRAALLFLMLWLRRLCLVTAVVALPLTAAQAVHRCESCGEVRYTDLPWRPPAAYR